MIEIEFEPISLSIDEEYITAQLTQLGSRSVTSMTLLMDKSPPTGNRYGKHVASSPGNAPRTRGGDLRQKLAFDAAGTRLEIGANLFYFEYLEDGTTHEDGSVKMAPRPLLEMGVNKTIAEWPNFLDDFVKVE